jgi:hypothetical protein
VADQSRTSLTDVTPEGATSVITGSLVDESAVALSSTDLIAFAMTLYAATSAATIINSRNAVNILNSGPGTITTGGAWSVTLSAADNDIITTPEPTHEKHVLLLEWTYSSSGANAKYGKHEIDFQVRSIGKVT